VLVFAGEFLRVRTGPRVRCAIGIAFERDGRDADHRELRKPPFQIVIFRLALREAESPAVIVDDDGYVIGIIKRRGAAIEDRQIPILAKRAAK